MSFDSKNIQEQICSLKYAVKKDCIDIMDRFREIEARVAEDIKTIEEYKDKGKSVIPEINFSDIVKNKIDNKTIKSVRRHGTVIIKNVFSKEKSSRVIFQKKQPGVYLKNVTPTQDKP